MRVSLAIDTTLGKFVAHYTESGLAGLDFPGTRKTPSTNQEPSSAQVRRWHALTTKALRKVLAGKVPPALPDMDLSRGSEFQRRVWQALRRIGPGETMSYAEVAAAIGQPRAARAVGGACGANPIPVLIPCHRVLAANRRLGGFSGGLDWKRKLLAGENAPELCKQITPLNASPHPCLLPQWERRCSAWERASNAEVQSLMFVNSGLGRRDHGLRAVDFKTHHGGDGIWCD